MLVTEPLRVTNMTEAYDIDATIDGGGISGQAGAMRLGIARSLCDVDPELRGALKRSGLLTRDARRRSRRSTGSRRPARRRSTPSGSKMAPTRFGTDGVRGVANEELTPELALALGRAAARVLPAPTFVVGRDTRRSGPLLQAAFSAGLAAEGADVVDLGVLPTPGVAAVAVHRNAPGAVISASHNPFGDNGIKLFSLLGTKLPTEVETRDRARARPHPGRPGPAAPPPDRPRVGRLSADPEAAELYVAHLVATAEGRRLDGLRIVVDCANGAASVIAPRVLSVLGARGHGAARFARRGQHQRQVRLDRPERAGAARWWRRRPTSVWPSTAMPTG